MYFLLKIYTMDRHLRTGNRSCSVPGLLVQTSTDSIFGSKLLDG